MISDLDADGNGSIDFGEWLTLMTKRVNDKDSRANISKIFLLFDSERTGFISAENLKRIASEIGETISNE
jgi:Ca2+-binding EF-hand superfamily protein